MEDVVKRANRLWEDALKDRNSQKFDDFFKKIAALVDILEKNYEDLNNNDELFLSIYHYAYMGCISGKYPARDLHAKISEIRRKLMTYFLNLNKWNVADVTLNLCGQTMLDSLNANGGWLPTDRRETLSNMDDRLSTDKSIVRYTKVRAVEFDFKQAVINIIADEYDPNDPKSPCLFTNLDVNELFGMGEMRGGPSLSLNHISSETPFHPFQRVVFSPSYMFSSRLMRCMFLCDYMLKWMNSGAEVQFKPNPDKNEVFECRPIEDGFLKLLPDNLKELVRSLRDAWISKSARIWFEADRAKFVQVNDEELDTETYHFCHARMLFKQQESESDENGMMVDVKNDEQEGWPCFVFNEQEFNRLKSNQINLAVDKAFVVFKNGSNYNCSFWQLESSDNSHLKEVAKFEVTEESDALRPLLDRLCKVKTINGRVPIAKFEAKTRDDDAREDEANNRIELVYYVLKIAAERANQEHGYSNLFCFAQKMTESYDSFAEYVPEFARLRELSKLVAIAKLVAKRREELRSNAEKLASEQGLIEWIFTSTDERKRLNTFEKALKKLQYGVLEKENYSTVEQEEKLKFCHWVPVAIGQSKEPIMDENGLKLPGFIIGGATFERGPDCVKAPFSVNNNKEAKAQNLDKNTKQGHQAENYHLEQILKKNPDLIVFAQVPIRTGVGDTYRQQMRTVDFLLFNPKTGQWFAHEIKSGNDTRNDSQIAKDRWIQANFGGNDYWIETTEFNYTDTSVFKEYSNKQTRSRFVKVNNKNVYMPLHVPKNSGGTNPSNSRIILPPSQRVVIPEPKIIIPSRQGVIVPGPRVITSSQQKLMNPVRFDSSSYSRPPVGIQNQ